MTGRAAGYCAGYGMPGYANPVPGRGFGLGRGGWGRGWRHWYHATGLAGWARFWGYGPPALPTKEQEAESLKTQAGWLQEQLDAITRRIADLEGEE
jgi:hypothetical protein